MRRMVSDGQDVYRVVVTVHKRKPNPEYVQGKGQPYWILLDETNDFAYGPYNSLGTAKAVLTRETADTRDDGSLRWGVAGGRIEKADTVWTEVDLDARG